MRKIEFEEYDKKRKSAKLKLLQIRDELDTLNYGKAKKRNSEKQSLLFKLAKEKKERIIEKVGERKYRFKQKVVLLNENYLKKKIKYFLSSKKSDLYKKIAVIAVLTEVLSDLNVKPIIVGGQAVEFYTAGGYTTMDIDIICECSTAEIDKRLKPLDFKKIGKYWTIEDSDIAIEVPSGPLAGQREKVIEVEVENGFKAYIIGIEDIIIDRLNSFKYWNIEQDKEWLIGMIYVNFDDIDWEYLFKKAESEGTAEELRAIKKIALKKIKEDF